MLRSKEKTIPLFSSGFSQQLSRILFLDTAAGRNRLSDDQFCQQMIPKRRLQIQEIKRLVELSEQETDREIKEGVQFVTDLKEFAERKLNEFIKTTREKQKTTKKQAEDSIKKLEEHISELMKSGAEVDQLSRCEDQLHLLQNFQSLNIHLPPPGKDETKVSVPPESHDETVRRALATVRRAVRRAQSQLEGTLIEEMKQQEDERQEDELKRVKGFAVDVTLDPDTAHRQLVLSDDGKQVRDSNVRKKLPDNPERFSRCCCVLAKQSFSSGRFYYQAQVRGKTGWDIGVARESIKRKEDDPLSPQNGYWTLWLRNITEYRALDDPPVVLTLKTRPQTVGVFVDYEEGVVSFYDVEAAALIYSFTGCCFKEKLYPYFSPCINDGGKNSAPMIITPVRESK